MTDGRTEGDEAFSAPFKKLQDSMAQLVRVTKEGNLLSRKSTKDIKALGDSMKKMGGSLVKMGFAGIATTVIDLLFSFPAQLKKIEEFGAKFSKSFEEASSDSVKLSESIKGGVDVYDAFVLSLNLSRRGLDKNSAFVKDLATITKVTGENLTDLLNGMMRSSIGIGDNNSNIRRLNTSMEFFSRAFNRSRTELVKAMTNLTQETLNLVAMGGARGMALQEGFMMLKSFIPDEGLFQSLTAGIQKLLSPAGLTQSLILGFDSSKFLTGQAGMADLMMSTLKLEEKALDIQRMVARSGAGVQASLGALRSVFGDVGTFLRGGNAIRQMAAHLQIDTTNKTSRQIVNAILTEGGKRAEANKKFDKTITRIQNEIFRPLKNSMAQIGLEVKKLLDINKNTIQDVVRFIGDALLTVMRAVVTALEIFATGDLDDELKKIRSAMAGVQTDFRNMGGKSVRALDVIADNTDPDKVKRDLSKTFKEGNLFAVRQTDALLLDIYTTMLKSTKIQEAMSRRGVDVIVRPGSSSAGGVRVPGGGK